MAIWAIANVVRKMTDPDPDSADQRCDSENRDAEQSVHRKTAKSVGDELEYSGKTTAPIASEDHQHMPVAVGRPADNERVPPSEHEFPFEEIDQAANIPMLGNRPATECLEIELGTASMQTDDIDNLSRGVVVALQERVEDEVVIRHAHSIVARGRMTVVDGKIAVRIRETYNP